MCPVFRMSKGKSKDISGVSEVNLYGMRGEIRINEPMSRHTSWRTGGAARRFYLPADVDDMGIFLRGLPFEEPINMIGLGSNLLVRDGGLPGTTIALHARLNDLQLVSRDCSGGLIYAGAGVACAKVARFAIKHQLIGAEFLAGIPGTVGGALAMNAGCYGAETWERVEKVQVINRNGEIAVREPDDYLIGYRSVQSRADLDNTLEWFTGGYFRLRPGDASASREKIKQLLTYRVSSQPLNKPNAGSVFRNPPGDHAARLIETCGLKGKRIGGAVVSEKHANFIVNIGGASAADIETLIMLVQETVEQKTGITLIPEVRIIGELGRNTQ